MVSAECELVSTERLALDHYELEIQAPQIAREAEPGQFVHVRVPRTSDPLLRRPFSVMLKDARKGWIRLLVHVVGRGTDIMVNLVEGSTLQIMGPLGTPFELPDPDQEVLLAAGGVGVAPLIALADELHSPEHRAYIRGCFGARTEDMLVCWNDFAGRCDEFYVRTEDGSAGEEGLVTAAVEEQIERGQIDTIYACGPAPMMKTVAEMAGQEDIPCYCSFEQRMGCGIGACLGCVIAAAGGGFVRVCKDGPVFEAGQLDWEAIIRDGI
ncbi:MAG: dihydroorotate dehydrogenase electron transfer subunit [Armatimonadota bacterium]